MARQAPPNPLEAVFPRRRSHKPRSTGVTMVADGGLSPAQQAEWLQLAAAYVDLAKIASGTSAVLPLETLRQKLEGYRRHRIMPFPGGELWELAVARGQADVYLQAAADAGFDCIEVSDQQMPLPLERKFQLIRQARHQYRLHVLACAPQREGRDAQTLLLEDAAGCLAAGAEVVLLDAAPFVAGDLSQKAILQLLDRCGIDRLVFEVPAGAGKLRTSGDALHAVHWLLERFGPEVNLGNVVPEGVLAVEALRLGIGSEG